MRHQYKNKWRWYSISPNRPAGFGTFISRAITALDSAVVQQHAPAVHALEVGIGNWQRPPITLPDGSLEAEQRERQVNKVPEAVRKQRAPFLCTPIALGPITLAS